MNLYKINYSLQVTYSTSMVMQTINHLQLPILRKHSWESNGKWRRSISQDAKKLTLEKFDCVNNRTSNSGGWGETFPHKSDGGDLRKSWKEHLKGSSVLTWIEFMFTPSILRTNRFQVGFQSLKLKVRRSPRCFYIEVSSASNMYRCSLSIEFKASTR